MKEKIDSIKDEVRKVVVGQEKVIDALIVAMLCDGHILLEGLPGLAKTTMVKSFAKTIGVDFKRVQFTPDLLPTDIIGAEIYDAKNSDFKIKHGPIFTNLLLADEINRAPAKVQSALLEAMSEKQVTIGEKSFKLQAPFLVLATQNPIEQEGAYRLPEAQLDRFMMKVLVGYNSFSEELEIAERASTDHNAAIAQVIDYNDIVHIKRFIQDEVFVDGEIRKYMLNLIFATRFPHEFGLDDLKPYINFGASPRASIELLKAAKAHAFLSNKDFVSPLDVAHILKDIVRHRIVLSYEAEAEGISADYILDKILSHIDIP